MNAELLQTISDIEADVTYFKNIGFDTLAHKFERDLNLIKTLITVEQEEHHTHE